MYKQHFECTSADHLHMSAIYIAYSIISITQDNDKGLTKNLEFHLDGFSGWSSARFGELCDILGLALITPIFNNLCIVYCKSNYVVLWKVFRWRGFERSCDVV